MCGTESLFWFLVGGRFWHFSQGCSGYQGSKNVQLSTKWHGSVNLSGMCYLTLLNLGGRFSTVTTSQKIWIKIFIRKDRLVFFWSSDIILTSLIILRKSDIMIDGSWQRKFGFFVEPQFLKSKLALLRNQNTIKISKP